MSAVDNVGATRLDVPSTDDPMQLSPDMDRRQQPDEDIDIDLEFGGDALGYGEDDVMEEELDEKEILQDDEMSYDGRSDPVHLEHGSLVDEDLQDVGVPLQDDDLEDPDLLADQDLQSAPDAILDLPPTDIEATSRRASDAAAKNQREHFQEDYSEDILLDLEPEIKEATSPNRAGRSIITPDERTAQQLPSQRPPGEGDPLEEAETEPIERMSNPQKAGERSPSPKVDYTEGDAEQDHEAQSGIPADAQPTTADFQRLKSTQNGNLSAQAEFDDESQQLEAKETFDSGNFDEASSGSQFLHPVLINYQGNEMSLFPPIDQNTDDSPTYLLDNEAYAAESLASLFQQCRDVLGESITKNEELEIEIPDLGLVINEQYADGASTTTLSQIIDIYVQLSQYDGLDDPNPLHINLSTHYKFSQRLEYLTTAASEGTGLSQLHFLDGQEDYADDNQIISGNEVDVQEQIADANNDAHIEPALATNPNAEQPIEYGGETDATSTKDVLKTRKGHIMPDAKSGPTVATSELATEPGFVNTGISMHALHKGEHESDQEGRQQEDHGGDDIIEYSDDEIEPEDSANSSTLQGDEIDELNKGSPAKIIFAEDNDNLEASIGKATNANSLHMDLNRSIQDQGLGNDVLTSFNEEQADHVQHHANPENIGDADEIIDYDEENIDEGISQSEHRKTYSEQLLLPNTTAVLQHTTESTTSSLSTDVSRPGLTFHAQTPNIDFEGNLDNVSQDVGEHARSHSFRDSIQIINDKDQEHTLINGPTDSIQRSSPNPDLGQIHASGHVEKTSGHTDDFEYDDDDEITIPDQVDSITKPTPSPSTLKRLRDDHSEELASDGFSYDAKRIRAA